MVLFIYFLLGRHRGSPSGVGQHGAFALVAIFFVPLPRRPDGTSQSGEEFGVWSVCTLSPALRFPGRIVGLLCVELHPSPCRALLSCAEPCPAAGGRFGTLDYLHVIRIGNQRLTNTIVSRWVRCLPILRSGLETHFEGWGGGGQGVGQRVGQGVGQWAAAGVGAMGGIVYSEIRRAPPFIIM